MKYKALIPNGLTSANLVFGVCSIFASMTGDMVLASSFILLALVADGLDGRAARFFGVSSEIGKELDSLCDLVSFGVAPAILAYVFCLHSFGGFGQFVSIVFALCGAWRLARFNVNAGVVHGYFMGLAIPAGGCLVATSTLFMEGTGTNPASLGWAYPLLMLITAFLMVSEVHYPDFKGKGEGVSPVTKGVSVLIFLLSVYAGRESIVSAVLFAIFAAYAPLGVVNTLTSGRGR